MSGSPDSGAGHGSDPPPLLLGAAAVAAAAPRWASALDRADSAHGSAPIPSGGARGASPPACPRASTPGRRRSHATGTAIRSLRGSIGCCSSTCRRLRTGRRTPARGVAAHARAHLPVGSRTGCCSPPVGAPGTSSGCWASASPIPRAKRCRTSSCRRSTTTTSACTSRATTNGVWRRSRRRSCTARRCGCRRALDVAAALRWRETRTGFVGAGLPAAHQNVGGIPAGTPVAQAALRCSWASSRGSRRNQATEDDVTIPTGAVRAGDDDAGQLHAPAAGQLVSRALSNASGSRACTRPRSPPSRSATSRPTPKSDPNLDRPGDQPLRRDRTLADLGAR